MQGMLTFIGLGLFDEKDISLKGIEAIHEADVVFAEFYTSMLMGTCVKGLEKLYNKPVHVLSREDVEQHPAWLDQAKDSNIVFLTGGDTMVSTTHVDLRLRAQEKGIMTRLIHGASITSAICGLSGLQNYRFGKASTVPHPYTSSRGVTVISETPYDTIKLNKQNGLHTLLFLDIDREKGYMTVGKALELLLSIEDKRKEGVMDGLAVGIARAGSPEPLVRADHAHVLKDLDLGGPLHILVIPASLHFVEADALIKFACAPADLKEVIDH